MSEKSDQIVARVRTMIHEITDPNELRRELEKMLTEEFPTPVAPFTLGETIPMCEFERRFKGAVCYGNETAYACWPVRIIADGRGELALALGTSATGYVPRATRQEAEL